MKYDKIQNQYAQQCRMTKVTLICRDTNLYLCDPSNCGHIGVIKDSEKWVTISLWTIK